MLKKDILDNMKNIVDNCMGDATPACVATCPMHTDVKGYMKYVREEKGEEAIKVIREKLFLPGTLGRICAHPCENKCKRGENQDSLAIAKVKRYAADNFDNEENWDMEKLPFNGKKVAIIGAGPAGGQSALELVKLGYKVVVYDKHKELGGMMRYGIPEYRLPREIIDKEYSYLKKLGVEFVLDCEVGKDISLSKLEEEFDAVIIAVGKQLGKKDNSLEGIEASGIIDAVTFLKEVSEKRKFEGIGKRVVVIGGGDVAMDSARSAIRLDGVEKVEVFTLESSLAQMASSIEEISGAIEEGVLINLARGIDKLYIDNNKIESIEFVKCTSLFDEKGMFKPVYDRTIVEKVEADTIIFAIGQNVDNSFDLDKKLVVRNNGTFDCDRETLQAKENPKHFVAGDACGDSFVVIQAMATGKKAAISVDRYLNNIDLKKDRDFDHEWTYETKLKRDIDWDTIEKLERVVSEEINIHKRLNTFEEVDKGYTRVEAMKEANRCFQCECKLCMKECMMMPKYTDCPKTLFKEYLEKGYENMDKEIAYSCNECSQCTIKCPKDFPIRENFMEMRKEYVKANNGDSPLEGHKSLDEGQELECSKEYSSTLKAKSPKTKYLLVPGCTVPAYSPELVEKTLEHLNEVLNEEVGAVLQCCAKPTLIIGEEEKFEKRFAMVQKEIDSTGADVIVTLCPSCYLTYDKYAKQDVVSYWDLMKDKIGIPAKQKGIGEKSDVVFNIHDACPTRNVKSHHESIRWIMNQLGYEYEEMANNRENTRCCGVGGMLGCINAGLYKDIVDRRAADATKDNIISYCGSCRGSMELGGLDSLHILDLVHGETYMKKDEKKRSVEANIGLENRLRAKKTLDKKR